MINREDMMELTRRMNLARTSITRIAGCYVDSDAYVEGTFNTSFLKLKPGEKSKNLEIAKAIPFAETNRKLRRYRFTKEAGAPGQIRQLLMGMKSCGLKNDELMELFYELIAGCYQVEEPYAVYVFHDRYDIPAKGTDHERQWESQEMFEYIICAICPLEGDYEPGEPECGFLFPAFSDRSANMNCIDIFQADPLRPHNEILELLGADQR